MNKKTAALFVLGSLLVSNVDAMQIIISTDSVNTAMSQQPLINTMKADEIIYHGIIIHKKEMIFERRTSNLMLNTFLVFAHHVAQQDLTLAGHPALEIVTALINDYKTDNHKRLALNNKSFWGLFDMMILGISEEGDRRSIDTSNFIMALHGNIKYLKFCRFGRKGGWVEPRMIDPSGSEFSYRIKRMWHRFTHCCTSTDITGHKVWFTWSAERLISASCVSSSSANTSNFLSLYYTNIQ